jgi:hypothetical protein
VTGEWDPLGMRGTVSRTLEFTDVLVEHDAAIMPRDVYFQAASRWPHMFLTLAPTYLGLAQAAYDLTVRYLRGEIPGAPPGKRRSSVVKQLAVAEMRIKLEQTKALWFQAVSEARVDPTPALQLGATVTIHPRVTADDTLRAIAEDRPTLTVLVPSTIQALLDHALWRETDLSSLRAITTGSTLEPRSLVDAVTARGVPLLQVYGSTETCPIAVYTRLGGDLSRTGSTGLPGLLCEARVVDEAGQEVPVAFIVVRTGAAVTVEELRAHLLSQLARFKVPREINFVADLRRNARDKVQHFRLRESYRG